MLSEYWSRKDASFHAARFNPVPRRLMDDGNYWVDVCLELTNCGIEIWNLPAEEDQTRATHCTDNMEAVLGGYTTHGIQVAQEQSSETRRC